MLSGLCEISSRGAAPPAPQRRLGQIEVSVALVTLLKHSHRVPALLSGLPPSAAPPHLTSGPGEGAGAPGRGAFAQERSRASWGHQALSSTGVQQTWDQVSLGDAPQSVPQ